ncbi:protein phosphatase 1F-like [Littorina saxatilis]|uniref:protein phosphatase 1F-like n=1 Tax=Littorina saxatilis TaxID=31220 RepID=UPI0038B5F903
MDDPNENETSSFKRFLETFCRDVTEPTRGSNDPSVRHVSYMLEQAEIEGESLQWALDYLCQTHEFPHGLAEQICREAFKRASQQEFQRFFDNRRDESSQSSSPPRIDLQEVHQVIEVHLYKVCSEWSKQLPSFVRPPRRVFPCSIHAIKNTRRRMEDRHVIFPDLNTLLQLQDSPSQSFYAVFDGHGGAVAAMFSASQLHMNLVRDPNFNSNPGLALTRAFSTTDKQFLHKAQEQKLGSGTTGVSLLVRGNNCWVAWLGDSQVMLVRDGRAVTLMEPHKPNREDERKRIEELGGSITNNGGVFRVNGNISVSRAIGDASMKPFLCSEADMTTFTLEGKEDYAVLACDGVWDVMEPMDVPFLVHSYLTQHPNDHSGVAKHLVVKAKEMGSGDNISCIVVFFRKDVAEPVGEQLEAFQFVRENGEHAEERGSDISGSQLGSGASTTSGSTGISNLTLSSTAGGGDAPNSSVDGSSIFLRRSSLYSRGRQIQGDFPHKLERQTGFFMPSVRMLRTGHNKQQLDPLAQGEPSRLPIRDAFSIDVSKKEELSHKPKPLSKGSSNSSTKRGPVKRKLKPRRRRFHGRASRTDSPDSSMRDSVSFSVDQSLGDDPSLASSVPALSLDSLAKHTLLAEILQQMSDNPGDENANPNSQDFLSVRGMSARLHKSLPRIPSRAPSSLLNSTTAMTPVTTSRRSLLHTDPHPHPQSHRAFPHPRAL